MLGIPLTQPLLVILSKHVCYLGILVHLTKWYIIVEINVQLFHIYILAKMLEYSKYYYINLATPCFFIVINSPCLFGREKSFALCCFARQFMKS